MNKVDTAVDKLLNVYQCPASFNSIFIWTNRGTLLDQTGPDGQEASGRPGGQHRQVPLRRSREPHADHPLAEERQGVQGRAEDGGHQGEEPVNTQGSEPLLGLQNLDQNHRPEFYNLQKQRMQGVLTFQHHLII